MDILLSPRDPATLPEPRADTVTRLRLLPHTHGASTAEGGRTLLTQHDQTELPARCRRILVANALVKARGLRRLYLVTGFLKLASPASDSTRLAPLLLHPAILARRVDDDPIDGDDRAMPDDDSRTTIDYEVLLETDRPLENTVLRDWCRARDITLPEYRADGSVAAYLVEVARCVSDHDGIDVESLVGFGTTVAPRELDGAASGPAAMPPRPEGFDASLALALLGARSPSMMNTVLALIDSTMPPPSAAPPTRHRDGRERPIPLSALTTLAARLMALGIGHLPFPRISDLDEELVRLLARIEPLRQAPAASLWPDTASTTPRVAIRLANAMELLDKAPLDFERYAHADLAHETAMDALGRARHQAMLITTEIDELATDFDWRRLPSIDELLSLIDDLRSALHARTELDSVDRFTIRRRYAAFARSSATRLDVDDLGRLVRLAKALRFRELFVNNAGYRRAFGPGYRGLKTDWSSLESASEFASEFASVLESRVLAIHALSDWPGFRSRYVASHQTLRSAAAALRTLLEIVGPSWQFRPIEALIRHVDSVRTPLAAILDEHAAVQARASGTPDDTMQGVGALDDDRMIDIEAEAVQHSFETWLADRTTSAADVASTLAWLREACRLAASRHDGLEHLGAALRGE